MSPRMVDAPAPQSAETQTTEDPSPAPRVSVLITSVEGADLEAALAIVRRQAYEPLPDIVVVGEVEDPPDDVTVISSLENAIAEAGSEVDYLWLLHSDARPRPDALTNLVRETERNEASLAGSKLLVAGTKDFLESVGSATDVFGEPYSGLEEGEIDLQQYDVVREVAFVRSASILVRRDLAQGLKGLDVLLPPVAAGLDFSQRARLAGGRVIIVPSSEVYHQGRCNEAGQGWREQAGRLRAMLTAYSPLTLLWLIPYDFIVSVLDAIGNLLLLRWRPTARYLRSWLWNVYHLPSTLGLRGGFRAVRSAGDEELFRFQARGSVRLRELGSELSARVLLIFDEDQALARSSRRVGSSPGIWGALLAALVLLVGVRGFLFSGVPDAGFSLPFEEASVAIDRWFAGWNETGLGSPNPVHPVVGVTGAVSWVLLGAEGVARILLTISFGVLGVLGMGRLSGRLGIRGPGRYLAGLVAIGGPGVAALTGVGSWLGLGAAAALPWAARASAAHPGERLGALTRYGWAIVAGLLLGSFSPLLAPVPLLFALLWKVVGGGEGRILLGLVVLASAGTVSAGFLLGDPGWALEPSRRLGLEVAVFWPVLVAVATVPIAFVANPARRLGLVGGLLSLSGLVAARAGAGGPGLEEAALILGSFGAAMVVSAGLNSFSSEPRRLLAVLASIAILLMSMADVSNGRLGLPNGQINERFDFASTLADEGGPGRVLVASTQRSDLPGEARSGPGFWYRLVDGDQMTIDEVWLAEKGAGDDALYSALESVASGSELRPGDRLGPFAVDWVVLLGPEFQLDEALVAQLDLVPTPLDPESRVFENPGAAPLAATEGSIWMRSGVGFSGDPGDGRVALAVNYDAGWGPEPERVDWSTSVSASNGEAIFEHSNIYLGLVIAAVGLLLIAGLLLGLGRVRR
jgi:hypothetical protein